MRGIEWVSVSGRTEVNVRGVCGRHQRPIQHTPLGYVADINSPKTGKIVDPPSTHGDSGFDRRTPEAF